MNVDFSEEVTVTGTASVSIEDITSALQESLDNVEYVMGHSDTPNTKSYVVQRFVDHCLECLMSVTDEMMSEVSVENRSLIHTALREQARRWMLA